MRLVAIALVVFSAPIAFADSMPAPPSLPTPAPHIGFSGGDGLSCDAPIVIKAEHESEGIRAERWWVFTKNQGAKIEKQSVSSESGKDLETITLTTADGGRKTVCFDITSFYGKP
jgi:hypothetical protein